MKRVEQDLKKGSLERLTKLEERVLKIENEFPSDYVSRELLRLEGILTEKERHIRPRDRRGGLSDVHTLPRRRTISLNPHWEVRPRQPIPPAAKVIEVRRGFCQVIVNADPKLFGHKDEEVVKVFKSLEYEVKKVVCAKNDELKQQIDSIAKKDYTDKDILVCFILSSVTENFEILSSNGDVLNVRYVLMKFNGKSCLSLHGKPKIFILLGHRKDLALEFVRPAFEKTSVIPAGERNFLLLYAPYNKGYLSTLLSSIKQNSSKHDILNILCVANKSFKSKTDITIHQPIHNLQSKVYLNVPKEDRS